MVKLKPKFGRVIRTTIELERWVGLGYEAINRQHIEQQEPNIIILINFQKMWSHVVMIMCKSSIDHHN